MVNRPVLSICIVSYNKKEELKRTIDKLLIVLDSLNIEIAVSDDGSTDGTVELMHEYERKYNRIKFYTRSEALGAIKNWMVALMMGSGKYVMTLNDRDTIEPDNLNDLIGILDSEKYIVAGYCDPHTCDNSIRYYEGIDILSKLAYKSLHPSGYFFDRDELNELPCLRCDMDYLTKDNVGYWPHDFAVAECFKKGKIIIYKKKLVVMPENEYLANHRSGVDNASVENVWFSPKQRLGQLKRIVKHMKTLPLDAVDRFFLINQAMYRQLKYATITYAEYREKEYECMHYGIDTKKISIEEIKRIIIEFKKEYSFFLDSERFAWGYKLIAKVICNCYMITLMVKRKS